MPWSRCRTARAILEPILNGLQAAFLHVSRRRWRERVALAGRLCPFGLQWLAVSLPDAVGYFVALTSPCRGDRSPRQTGSRLPVDTLRRQSPMIDARPDVGFSQGLIGQFRPPRPERSELLARRRQPKLAAHLAGHVDARFRTQTFPCHLPSRREEVRVEISRIALGPWRMDREVDGDIVAVGDLARERSGKDETLLGGQLLRQRDLIFPCNT